MRSTRLIESKDFDRNSKQTCDFLVSVLSVAFIFVVVAAEVVEIVVAVANFGYSSCDRYDRTNAGDCFELESRDLAGMSQYGRVWHHNYTLALTNYFVCLGQFLSPSFFFLSAQRLSYRN